MIRDPEQQSKEMMPDINSDSVASKLRRPPQITLALDSETHVLYVNRDLAGTGFANLTEDADATFHELIHPDCDGCCRFNTLLKKAWTSLSKGRGSIEWEIEDAVLKGRLRLNLSRPPVTSNLTFDRRRRFALLIVTDITEIRREYELVLAGNKELLRRVDELEGVVADIDNPDSVRKSACDDEVAEDERLLGQLSTRIIAAQEHERRRIAADLHDGVAQTLGVVKYGVEARLARLERDYPDIDLTDFDLVIDQIKEAVDDVRNISRNLSPSILDEFGICVAIDMLCNEFGSEVSAVSVQCTSCVDEVMLPDIVKVAIYRVVQEALNNIQKHAAAEWVEVQIISGDQDLSLTISDDGTGFEGPEVMRQSIGSVGMGLTSMRERVEATGGEFVLQSRASEGTVVLAKWPHSALHLLSN